MMKTILKLLVSLVIGMAAGIVIAAVGIALFTDMTFSGFFAKLQSTDLAEILSAAGVGILSFIISLTLLIIIHEAGHLVCGLLTGYGFVSFRIFSLTFIRIDGKLRMRRYSVAGTGGQCLLTPPDLPLEEIPTGWYNFGGVLFNLIALLAIMPLFFLSANPFVKESALIFALIDIIMIVMNGIPMKVSGVGNDAYNMLLLRKNPVAKLGLISSLRANALIQNGVRPKDMPDELFEGPEKINYKDQLEVSIPMMGAARLIDELNYRGAREAYETLYDHREEMIQLYVKEIACELVFLRLMTDDPEGAKVLLDKDLEKYIAAFRKVMSSKERIQCAVALKLEGRREEAVAIYEDLLRRRNDYLLQGEVRSDLAVMRDILEIPAD